jgi:hypothetical protein
MTNLQRRIRRLEANLTDPSGLVPHSPKWLAYWDRQIYDYVKDGRWPAVLFPIEAFRAVMSHMKDSYSLVGSVLGTDE